ncbi:hypothetical protein GCM10009844_29380 [Nocardioides koreensis]|uniref:Uncharacterized protein n=1 Tax=Nocardioides koreensis TaxID=433651 RepID=A0ABP5LQJ4_9ACTN
MDEQKETLSQGRDRPPRGRKVARAMAAHRRGLLVSVVVVLALSVGVLSLTQGSGNRHTPLSTAAAAGLEVHRWPDVRFPDSTARDDTPPLERAVYELQPSWQLDDLTVRLTTFDGWYAAEGPVRWDGDGYASLLVLDVTGVMSYPCGRRESWRTPTPNESSYELVGALARMPRMHLITPPEPVQRFGNPTTHLHVRTTPDATCPAGADLELVDTVDQGVISSPGPRADLDLWVVDVDGDPLLVMAAHLPGTPASTLHQLQAMVASVEFVRHGD